MVKEKHGFTTYPFSDLKIHPFLEFLSRLEEW